MTSAHGRPNPTLTVWVLAFAGLAVTVLQTLIVPIIPELPRILNTGPADASWVITATLVSAAVATPSLTRLADMYGKRPMVLACLWFMLGGSILVGLTTNIIVVVIGRVLQGVSIAIIPIGMSVMRDVLPPHRLPGAVALLSAMYGIGGAIGLPTAGVIYHAFGWGALFAFTAVIAALGLVAAYLFVPASGENEGGTFDWRGAVILSVALVGLLLAITKGGEWGLLSRNTLVSLVVAVVGFAIFVPWQLRIRIPLVDLATTMRRPVLLTNLASTLVSFAMYVNMLTTTQMLQVPKAGFGLSAAGAGLAMIPAAGMSILLAPVSAKLIGRFGARSTLVLGASIVGVGFLIRTVLVGNIPVVIIGSAGLSMGSAIAMASMPVLIMQAVPVNQTAAANGLNSLVRSIGTSASSAMVAGVLAWSTVVVGGLVVPTPTAFSLVHLVAGVAALIAVGLALFVPRSNSPG